MKRILVSALLILAASAAGAQSDTAITRLLDSARALGLPQAPLRSLVQEGRQRNVEPARVMVALRRYIGALATSRSSLGVRSTDAEIEAGASVLMSGADAKSVRAVRAARPDANITVALVVLADLVDRGVSAEQAEDAVVTLARVGASDKAFIEFRVGVQQDLASGQGAESSLLKRTRETVQRLQIMPVRKPPGLHLRGTFTSVFDRVTDDPQATAELLATTGLRRERAGIELGFGVASATGRAPQLPITFAAAWLTRGATEFRVEGRVAPASARSFSSRGALLPVGTIAYQVTDTLPNHGGGDDLPDPPAGDSLSPPTDRAPGSIGELRIGVTRGFSRFTFDAASGLRVLDARPFDAWTTLGASLAVQPRVALITGLASRYPIRTELAHAQTHIYFGLRFDPWYRARSAPVPAAPRGSSPTTNLRGAVVLRDGAPHFELMAKEAARVDIAGDFTGWESISMTATGGGRWRLALPASAGVLRLRVRVDGGMWMVPSGIARSRDAFGAEVGIIVLDAPRGS